MTEKDLLFKDQISFLSSERSYRLSISYTNLLKTSDYPAFLPETQLCCFLSVNSVDGNVVLPC